MKHHKFTESEREELLKCPHITRVKGSNVEYGSSFKAYALTAKKRGIMPTQIFLESGIPAFLIQGEYARSTLKRWVTQSKRKK